MEHLHWMRTADGNVTSTTSWETYTNWTRSAEREQLTRVAFDQVGDVKVSTVFLTTDHRFDANGPPILWETMVFGGPQDGWQVRYTSEAEAKAGHARVVNAIKAGLGLDEESASV